MITVGRDNPSYGEDTRSPAVNLLENKIYLNRIVSNTNIGARFMCADIKDHFVPTLID